MKLIKNTWKKLSDKKNLVILLILVVVLSEIAFNLNQIAGFVLYSSLIALFLLTLAHEENLEDYDKLMIVLMIIPIIRITGVFIALSFLWKTIISYSILLFLAFYYSIRFKLDHGHKIEHLSLLSIAILIGIVFGIVGNLTFELVKFKGPVLIIPLILLIAYSEEVLFRGMIQNLTSKVYGVTFSVIITALLYSMFCSSYGVLFGLFMFLFGIVAGIFYNHTKNIYLTVTINIILHYFLFVFVILK